MVCLLDNLIIAGMRVRRNGQRHIQAHQAGRVAEHDRPKGTRAYIARESRVWMGSSGALLLCHFCWNVSRQQQADGAEQDVAADTTERVEKHIGGRGYAPDG